MKISIDTHLDTPEDIHQAISLLASIAERKRNSGSNSTYTNNPYNLYSTPNSASNSSSTPPATSPMLMNMFSDDDSAKADTPPDFGSFLNLSKSSSETEKKDNDDDIPRIEIF